jgi:hypothetical protein
MKRRIGKKSWVLINPGFLLGVAVSLMGVNSQPGWGMQQPEPPNQELQELQTEMDVLQKALQDAKTQLGTLGTPPHNLNKDSG